MYIFKGGLSVKLFCAYYKEGMCSLRSKSVSFRADPILEGNAKRKSQIVVLVKWRKLYQVSQ